MWYKRTIPLIIVFVIGVLAFAQEYVPHPLSGMFREKLTTWFRWVGGFAALLGAYSLIHMHVSRIRRRMPGWAYSVFVFIGVVGMVAVGLYNAGRGPFQPPPTDRPTWFQWGYNNVQVPCGATIFSILAFFIASAAVRTFRVRNFSAALLLGAAVIVMFGRVPISESVGQLAFSNPQLFPDILNWVMTKPNLAAKRAILLGISLGAISQSLRVLFGIERSYMGGGE